MEGTEQRVFISYAAESREVALRLGEYLGERGWHSSIGRQLEPGRNWQDAVAEAIEGADAVVLLVGAQPSDALRFEWSLALRASWREEGKRVVPVLLLGAETPPFLRDVATVRLTDDLDEEGFERVLELIGSEPGDEPARDATDEQARLSERLDRAIEALRRDSPNEAELREHRSALAKSLEISPESARVILCLSIGLLDIELGEQESARTHLESALDAIESEDHPDQGRLITVLMPLGDVQAEMGDHEAAIATFKRVLAIQGERDSGSIGEAVTLEKLGVALVQADRPEEAKAHLARALEISRADLGKQHPRVSALELWLAVAAEACGDYEAAKEVYEEALASREEINPEDLNDQVTRLLGLGHALNQLGDQEGARQSLLRALELAEQGGVEQESLATIFVALGDVEQSLGNFDAALARFEQTIELLRGIGGSVADVALAQFRLGWTLLEMNRLSEAKKALSEALVLAEEAGGATDRTVINALFVLGLVAEKEGDKAQAEKRLRQAIDLQTQRDPSDERRLGEFQRALDQLLESSARTA